MKKRLLALTLSLAMIVGIFAGCGKKDPDPTPTPDNSPVGNQETQKPENPPVENLTAVQQIIKEAEGMTWEELAQKAIEESNGKTFYGVGNSSRGKSALPLFIEALQAIDPSYNMEVDWQQPKNNKIFDQDRKSVV